MSFNQIIIDGTVLLDTGNANSLLDVAPGTDTLATAITSTSATSIDLTSGAAVVSGTVINIGTERMRVTDDSANPTFTVERGYGGTTAATHLIAATVNIPGKLIYQLLTIAQAPNVELIVRKTSADINYVEIDAGSGNTFPGGGTSLLLVDNDTAGTAHIKFPGSGSTLILLASGSSAQAGPQGIPGPPGTAATPPGTFTIGSITAEWVVITQ